MGNLFLFSNYLLKYLNRMPFDKLFHPWVIMRILFIPIHLPLCEQPFLKHCEQKVNFTAENVGLREQQPTSYSESVFFILSFNVALYFHLKKNGSKAFFLILL